MFFIIKNKSFWFDDSSACSSFKPFKTKKNIINNMCFENNKEILQGGKYFFETLIKCIFSPLYSILQVKSS